MSLGSDHVFFNCNRFVVHLGSQPLMNQTSRARQNGATILQRASTGRQHMAVNVAAAAVHKLCHTPTAARARGPARASSTTRRCWRAEHDMMLKHVLSN